MAVRNLTHEQILGAIPAQTLEALLDFPGSSGWVVDLGSGEGSLDRRAFPRARIIAIDRTLTDGMRSTGARGIVADSTRLPIKGGICDVVVLNHRLQREPSPVGLLREARRILKDRGFLYVSLPDGYGFDDWLYRRLYGLCGCGLEGHGRLNRFSFEVLQRLTAAVGFTTVRSCDWLSDFAYLPAHPQWTWLGRLQRPLIALTRGADRVLQTRLSRYGWMLLLQAQSADARDEAGSSACEGSTLHGRVADDGRLQDDTARSVPWRPGPSTATRLYRTIIAPARAEIARCAAVGRQAAQRAFDRLAEPVRRWSDRRRYQVGKRFYEAVHRHLSGPRQYPDHFPMYSAWLEFALSTNLRGQRVAQQLQRYAPIRGARCLDVGCAYGGYPVAFARFGAEAFGIDVDEPLLSLSAENVRDQRLSVTLLRRDVTKAEELCDLGRFDIVTCNDVIEHVADVHATFCNLGALLKPGGLLYLEMPNSRSVGQVLKDGHYGLFGIALLPPRDAVRYYRESGCAGDYGVGYFHRLSEYEAFLAGSGIRLCEGDAIADDDAANRIEHVRGMLPAIRTALERRLGEPGLSPESRAVLHREVSAYLREVGEAIACYDRTQDVERRRKTGLELVRAYAIEFWQCIGVKGQEPAAPASDADAGANRLEPAGLAPADPAVSARGSRHA